MVIVPAKNGWIWLRQGFALFRRSPAMWMLLVFAYWLAIALLHQLQPVGALIATVLLPAFSVSFMAMCSELEQGRALRASLLFAGFRREIRTLVAIGCLYLLSVIGVLAISALADSGALWRWVMSGRPPAASAIRDGSLMRAMLFASAAATPVLLAFWFAPVLAAWGKMGAVKALFFSFFACWRNWRAFLVYCAVLALAAIFLSMVVAAAAVVASGNPEGVRTVMLLATLLILPTVFGSFYAGYRDIFPEIQSPSSEQGNS